MAENEMDSKSAYNATTKTYHSIHPAFLLPPETLPLSIPNYIFSSLCVTSTLTPLPNQNQPAFIDAATDTCLSYPNFLHQFQSLTTSLQSNPLLRKGNVALIISPPSLHIPVLYFSLLSLGVIVSPANPVSSKSEVEHICHLSKPAIVFATSEKIPSNNLPVIILDSPEFVSLLTRPLNKTTVDSHRVVSQSDTAAILYSSGTTGRVKGVELTHRNLISVIVGTRRSSNTPLPKVTLFTVPLFHVFGFFMALRAVAEAQTVVLMGSGGGGGMRFDFEGMLKSIERYKVNYMPVSPPLVIGLLNSELTGKYDLSSLVVLGCGGAALGEDVARRFEAKFPNIKIAQGYGLTETAGGIVRTVDEEEMKHYGSAGRLSELVEAKIVDPSSGQALPPNQRGELWVRGPSIMKGYVGDDSATTSTLTPDGWLKTGDLCYFDSQGFMYIVDRLKELIKYKAYQVPPAELETVLLSHQEIADAAVIAYPDEEAGEIPVAFVVRKSGTKLTPHQIMAFVSKQVAPYKKIRKVFFTEAIPKSPAGKILRRQLTAQAVRTSTSAKL